MLIALWVLLLLVGVPGQTLAPLVGGSRVLAGLAHTRVEEASFQVGPARVQVFPDAPTDRDRIEIRGAFPAEIDASFAAPQIAGPKIAIVVVVGDTLTPGLPARVESERLPPLSAGTYKVEFYAVPSGLATLAPSYLVATRAIVVSASAAVPEPVQIPLLSTQALVALILLVLVTGIWLSWVKRCRPATF